MSEASSPKANDPIQIQLYGYWPVTLPRYLMGQFFYVNASLAFAVASGLIVNAEGGFWLRVQQEIQDPPWLLSLLETLPPLALICVAGLVVETAVVVLLFCRKQRRRDALEA